ncbi:MAG: hypothetical protein NT126_04970, partial [Bacteroidetes bacterium]|nr:hypothetical protein [Bacteroidota bacterium]
MKAISTLLFTACLLLLSFEIQAQTTLTLQPDAGAGKDALIQERTTDLSVANGNFPNETSFEAVAWTW